MDSVLADIVVVVHLIVVIFMIGGLLAIVIGWPLEWQWIRNPWWRFAHLAIMAYIAFNAMRDELCFLTIWEEKLRDRAGQHYREELSFVGRVFQDVLYVEVPTATLNIIYLVFGALVAVSALLVRPRFQRRDRASA